MDWLNYHHLYYFWRVATLGSISAAAQELRLRQPTISNQLSALEGSLGRNLFERQGRRLILTEEGRIAFRYSEEIFATGRELMDVLSDRPAGRPIQCSVGVVDMVPKLIAYRLLKSVYEFSQPVRLECHEDSASTLLGLLAVHKLDLVLSDSPISSDSNVRAFNHLMGETDVGLFCKAKLARRLRRGFPSSLEGQSMLLPLSHSLLRRNIDRWLEEHSIRVRIQGEFDDSALMKSFGEGGCGIFPGPMVLAKEIQRRHAVSLIATLPDVVERFYGISLSRRIRNPVIDELISRGKTFLQGKRE